MGRMQKDDERAREIAYTIRTKDMGQEEIVKLLVKLIEDVREETALALLTAPFFRTGPGTS